MESDTTTSPAEATRIPIANGKCHQTTRGKVFENWHKVLHSIEAKSYGLMADVEQQGYGGPRGGHVVDSSG
jgi:hypothetical protein